MNRLVLCALLLAVGCRETKESPATKQDPIAPAAEEATDVASTKQEPAAPAAEKSADVALTKPAPAAPAAQMRGFVPTTIEQDTSNGCGRGPNGTTICSPDFYKPGPAAPRGGPPTMREQDTSNGNGRPRPSAPAPAPTDDDDGATEEATGGDETVESEDYEETEETE